MAEDFKMYPNPVSTFIGIQYKTEDKEIKAEIIDSKGVHISTSNFQSSRGFYDEKINIGNLPAGVYFLTITGSRNSLTRTFIKK